MMKKIVPDEISLGVRKHIEASKKTAHHIYKEFKENNLLKESLSQELIDNEIIVKNVNIMN